jgi:hypothetical protein
LGGGAACNADGECCGALCINGSDSKYCCYTSGQTPPTGNLDCCSFVVDGNGNCQ